MLLSVGDLISALQVGYSVYKKVSSEPVWPDPDALYVSSVKTTVLGRAPQLKSPLGIRIELDQDEFANRLRAERIDLTTFSPLAVDLNVDLSRKVASILLQPGVLLGCDPTQIDLRWAIDLLQQAHQRYQDALMERWPDQTQFMVLAHLASKVRALADEHQTAYRSALSDYIKSSSDRIATTTYTVLSRPERRPPDREFPRPELQSLSRKLQEGETGNRVLITGEAGVGKSTFANALAREFLAGERLVLALDARNFRACQSEADLAHALELSGPLRDVLMSTASLRDDKRLYIVVDQLDGAFDVPLPGLIRDLARAHLAGVIWIVFAKSSSTTEREGVAAFRADDWHVESLDPLDASWTNAELNRLGITDPNQDLVDVCRIPMHMAVYGSMTVGQRAGLPSVSSRAVLADIWRARIQAVLDKHPSTERHRLSAVLLELAVRAQASPDGEFEWTDLLHAELVETLESHRLLALQGPTRGRFYHELIPVWVLAVDAARSQKHVGTLLDRIAPYRIHDVVIATTSQMDPQVLNEWEVRFIEDLLTDDRFLLSTREEVLDHLLPKVGLPHMDLVEVMIGALKRGDSLASSLLSYRLGPEWAQTLLDHGLFTEAPEPVDAYLPYWPAHAYLTRAASAHPQVVVEHFKRLRGHAQYRGRALGLLTSLPTQYAVACLDLIIRFFVEQPHTAHYHIHRLFARFVEAHEWASVLALLEAMLHPISVTRTPSSLTNDLFWGQLDGAHLRVGHLLDDPESQAALAATIRHRPIDVLQLVETANQQVADLMQVGSHWIRDVIAGHERASIYPAVDDLLEVQRDCLYELVRVDSTAVKARLAGYLEASGLARRLALHVLARHSDRLRDLALASVDKPELWRDQACSKELAELFQAIWPFIPLEHQGALFDKLWSGAIWQAQPTAPLDTVPLPKAYVDQLARDWLALIAPSLNGEQSAVLDQLIHQYGPARSPLPQARDTTWSNTDEDTSDSAELQALDGPTLIERARTVSVSEPDPFFRGDRFAIQLARAIRTRRQELGPQIITLLDVRPTLANHLFNVTWRYDEGPYDPAEWALILELAEKIVEVPATNTVFDQSTQSRINLDVVRMIESGVLRDDARMPEDHWPAACRLLAAIAHDPAPDEARQREMFARVSKDASASAINIVINEPRTEALATLIDFCCWAKREEKRELQATLWQVIQSTWAQRSGQASAQILADIYVLSDRLPWLAWLDRGFADQFSTRCLESHDQAILEAAWRGLALRHAPAYQIAQYSAGARRLLELDATKEVLREMEPGNFAFGLLGAHVHQRGAYVGSLLEWAVLNGSKALHRSFAFAAWRMTKPEGGNSPAKLADDWSACARIARDRLAAMRVPDSDSSENGGELGYWQSFLAGHPDHMQIDDEPELVQLALLGFRGGSAFDRLRWDEFIGVLQRWHASTPARAAEIHLEAVQNRLAGGNKWMVQSEVERAFLHTAIENLASRGFAVNAIDRYQRAGYRMYDDLLHNP